MPPRPVVSLLLLRAYQNERCLDLRYRSEAGRPAEWRALPNYKLMKQVAIQQRLTWLYGAFVRAALLAIPALSLVQGLLALVSSFRAGPSASGRLHIIATTASNIPVIRAAVGGQVAGESDAIDTDVADISALARALGPRDVIAALSSVRSLYGLIRKGSAEELIDLRLHARDAVVLSLLVHYALKFPAERFATDAHYERQAFLLSHASRNLVIVQHGYLDEGIVFPHPFGSLSCLCVRDESFVPAFRRYFEIDLVRDFRFHRPLTVTSLGYDVLVLASSFPAIDLEIELMRCIRETVDVPIIIKLHPNHTYDARRHVLLALATYVCRADEYPLARIFVSFNSYLEYDYLALGTLTFAIARQSVEGIAAAVRDVVTGWSVSAEARARSPER